MPQLALATSTGSEPSVTTAFILSTAATTSEAPMPQLVPQAWTRGLVCWCKFIRSEVPTPIMVRPLVSKLMVNMIGKPASPAPFTASSTSSSEDMVSIHNTSAPPRCNASACSANASMASSGCMSPSGERISPLGPIEPATIISRPETSISFLRISTAAVFSSATRCCALCNFRRKRVPPKVLDNMISEPASIKLR